MAIYGNIVGGNNGGIGLNFQVVNKSSQPTDPKENTIWINTSYVLNCWTYGPDLPLRRSKNKNFVTYPYYETTHTEDGITFTDNEDGTVTANGTATAESNFRASYTTAESGMFILTPGTYTLSGCPEGGGSSTYALVLNRINDSGVWANYLTDTGSGNTFTVTRDTVCNAAFRVYKGATVENLTFYFQVEAGSSKTDFERGNANGQVWIKPNPNSPVSFEAFKKNGSGNNIVLQPGECQLFRTNYGWTKYVPQVYQNGTWIEIDSFSGYYYNAGSLCESVTGGWATTGWTSTTHNINQLSAINTDHLYVVASSSALSAVGTINKVDISSVSKIKASVEITNPGRVVLCICDTYAPQDGAASSFVTTNGTHEISLDVSGFNGSYYIIIYAESLSSQIPEAKITSVWGE